MIDKNPVLGPYIEIPTQYYEYTSNQRKCGCKVHHNKNKYCQDCGEIILDNEILSKRALSARDILGNDHLFEYISDDKTYLFSNMHYCDMNTDDNVLNELNNYAMFKSISIFKDFHKDDIKKLKEIIKHNIIVKFGFINICS